MSAKETQTDLVVPYDPEKYVLIRDWCNHNDCDIADVFVYLRKQKVGKKKLEIVEVVNPYAEALGRIPEGKEQSESFSPTSRALKIEDKHFLDEFLTEVGPRKWTRDIRITFTAQDNGDFTASRDDIEPVPETWYIDRPAEITLQDREMEVTAHDFNFPPPAYIRETILYLYGLIRITEAPMVINGVTLSFVEAQDSGRSRLPGGFRWGKYYAHIDSAQKARILGH